MSLENDDDAVQDGEARLNVDVQSCCALANHVQCQMQHFDMRTWKNETIDCSQNEVATDES